MLIRIIFCIIFTYQNIYIVKHLLKIEDNLLTTKNIVLFILLVINYIFVNFNDLSGIIPGLIVKYILCFIITMFIFNKSYTKTLFSYIIYAITIIITDMINTSIYMQFIPINTLRTNTLIVIIANITAIVIAFILFRIIIIINNKINFIEKIKIKEKYENNFYILTTFIIILYLFYNMAKNYQVYYDNKTLLNSNYLLDILLVTSILLIIITYVRKSVRYKLLEKNYDNLFDYMQEFEELIDNISIDDHELKNELLILRNYIEEGKKKEALQVIDDIKKITVYKDNNLINELKNIPKGGIKGIIYYKLLMAKSKNINIEIDVSDKIKNKLKDFEPKDYKRLCQILGIYLDNAIDASINSNKSLLALEIYSIDKNKIEIVISNTYKDKVNLDKIGTIGYSTKGKNRGRGTYLAKKLIEKTSYIKEQNNITELLYIKKIIIDLDKIKTD